MREPSSEDAHGENPQRGAGLHGVVTRRRGGWDRHLRVRAIRSYAPSTRIAGAAAHIEGGVRLGGVIVPIPDPRIEFALESSESDESTAGARVDGGRLSAPTRRRAPSPPSSGFSIWRSRYRALDAPASLRTGARIFLDCQSVDSIARDSGPFMTPAARWIANPAEAAGAWAADASPTSLRSLARAIWRLQGAERRVPLRVGPAVRAAIDRHDGIGTTDVRGRRATPVSVGSARHRKARVRCGSMDGKARWPGHCHARISSETAGRCAPKLRGQFKNSREGLFTSSASC